MEALLQLKGIDKAFPGVKVSIKLYASMGRSTPSSKPRTKRGS